MPLRRSKECLYYGLDPLRLVEAKKYACEANRLPYAQFLELLFQDEINVRHQRLFNRRYKLADFRETRVTSPTRSPNPYNKVKIIG